MDSRPSHRETRAPEFPLITMSKEGVKPGSQAVQFFKEVGGKKKLVMANFEVLRRGTEGTHETWSNIGGLRVRVLNPLPSRRRTANHSDNKLSLRIHSDSFTCCSSRQARSTKSPKTPIIFFMPVCLSARTYQRRFHWMDFWRNLFASELRVGRAWYKAQVKIKLCLPLSLQRSEQTLAVNPFRTFLYSLHGSKWRDPEIFFFRFSATLISRVMEWVW